MYFKLLIIKTVIVLKSMITRVWRSDNIVDNVMCALEKLTNLKLNGNEIILY